MYTIELLDKTKLENIDRYGNNFVSFYPVTEDTFKNSLSLIKVISDSGKVKYYKNIESVKIINDYYTDGMYHFTFIEKFS